MTLNNIAWSFTKDFYTDADKFNSDVTEYQKNNYKDTNRWNPNEIVFNIPDLQIQYMAWVTGPTDLLENETLIEDDEDVFKEEPEEDEYGYQVEILAKLKADNGKNFYSFRIFNESP